jgi:surface antigen
MRAGWHARLTVFVATIVATSPAVLAPAFASTSDDQTNRHKLVRTRTDHVSLRHVTARSGRVHHARGGGVQCVPFARAASGIELKGNAANWWDAADGVYARGTRPEPGAVLNFRATGGMRLGHVAVVTAVLNSREIEIEHANWASFGRGNVSRGARVVDVSATNDWSAVRVELGHTGDFGSVYPTYGFIYDRPDTGVMIANTPDTARPSAERPQLDLDEVAEAPGERPVIPAALPVDAPPRNLR